MNGPLAQIVALTCHGNAHLSGKTMDTFFPDNSTCTFCDYIHFLEFKKSIFGKVKERLIANNPNEWIQELDNRGATVLKLTRTPQNDPNISDRMSAGFVGGGGQWAIVATYPNGEYEYWIARWEVWNQEAKDRRIWRVDYAAVSRTSQTVSPLRDSDTVFYEFHSSIKDIHAFSKRMSCDGFTKCFEGALTAMEDSHADIGYHKDLYLDDQIGGSIASLLKAAMVSWVYGGMGSWNDMGFDGRDQIEYDKVSERHFQLLNEAIEVAASSTHPDYNVEQGVSGNVG